MKTGGKSPVFSPVGGANEAAHILSLNSRISNEKKGHLPVTFFDRLSALPCKGEGRSRFGEKAIYTRGWLGMGYGPRISQIVGTGSPPSLRRTKGTQ